VKVFKVDPSRSIDKLAKVSLPTQLLSIWNLMSAMEAIRREIRVSLRLNHPGIVPLLGTAMVGSPLPALVSQWMPSGTLFEYLKRPATLPARYGLVGCLFT